MYTYLKNLWLTTSLRRKLGIYTAVVVLVMGLSAAFNINLMNYALDSFSYIMRDNARCHDFQTAIDAEAEAFENYARTRNKENHDDYVAAKQYTRRSLGLLPESYHVTGSERYARIWNIKNAYETYSKAQEVVLDLDTDDPDFVPKLYEVYTMQDYLQSYARRLLQMTMLAGDEQYQTSTTFYQNAPYLIVLFSMVMILLSVIVTRQLSKAWLDPLGKLVMSTKKIAVNDYSGEDVVVENRDEMGEMVQAFNKMKHATKGYIDSLMDNYEMSEKLHEEEMERIQTEKRLEDARMELLKSQINPHFLFNTLNTISCMAKLEDAEVTDHMITSMSNLFRYNLKTQEQIVPLFQELKVVEDYIYIQKMRFGSRIGFRSDISVDDTHTTIPAFTLQPLVENAFIHGLSKKEQGGTIVLRVWKNDGVLTVSVSDTGLGMTQERRKELLEALNESSSTARIGIGLGNICKRIHSLYPGSEMQIYSREGCGTAIQIKIPQEGDTYDTTADSR
jgi:sensor histidine kinase YesM